MALAFDANYYLSTRPDVFNAFVATAGATGQTWAQFASAHYNNFGRFEGSNPNSTFNTREYLSANPDVAAAGVNPFTHFLNFGAKEGRAPSASFPSFASFDEKAYLAANADLGTAGITTKGAAYEHFVKFGQFEGRPGAPAVDTGVPGQTFTLTNSVDNVVGTSANDTIVAGDQGGIATLGAGDQINGGAGVDTLNIFSGAANFGSATVKGVEIVNVNEDAGLDVSGNADIKQIWQIGGVAKTTTATVAQTIGFGNVNGGGVAVATFTNVAGSVDAATIAVKDAGKTTAYTSIAAAGIETLTINASGSNSLGTLTAVDAAKLVFTGSGSVSTTLSDDAAYKTIDGSAATGALSIVASGAAASAQTLDIKTGSAGDSYTTLFANLTKDDKIDLGAGSDTLAFADATDLSVAGNVANLAGVTNVETLRVNGTAAFAVDGDLVSQSLFNHSSTGAFTGTNFANTDKLTVGAVDISDSTVAMKLGQNTFNLDLVGSATTASSASKLTVTGASTVNVSSAGTAGVADNVLDLITDSNGTVKVAGAQNLTLTTGVNGGATTGLVVDAAGFTGKLNVTGTANADQIIGGSGADTITGGAGVDTLTGGAGADKFIFATADVDTTAGAVTDIIADFVTKVDKLEFGFGAGSATNYVEATAVAADLATLLTAADAALAGAIKYYVGQVGADSYVVTDNNANGYTDVVKLTGVSLAGIEFGDITA